MGSLIGDRFPTKQRNKGPRPVFEGCNTSSRLPGAVHPLSGWTVFEGNNKTKDRGMPDFAALRWPVYTIQSLSTPRREPLLFQLGEVWTQVLGRLSYGHKFCPLPVYGPGCTTRKGGRTWLSPRTHADCGLRLKLERLSRCAPLTVTLHQLMPHLRKVFGCHGHAVEIPFYVVALQDTLISARVYQVTLRPDVSKRDRIRANLGHNQWIVSFFSPDLTYAVFHCKLIKNIIAHGVKSILLAYNYIITYGCVTTYSYN